MFLELYFLCDSQRRHSFGRVKNMLATYTQGDEPVPGYRLVRMLGWGRFGEVWLAHAPGGFEAALKFISLGSSHGIKEYLAIRLFKQLRHPNLVPLNALWLKD